MISSPAALAALAALDAEDARVVCCARSYDEALALFTALWCYAREINPEIGANWRDDIRADIAVARAVNGLSPAA